MSQIILIYDGACLLCQQFATYMKLRKKHDLIILNAREEVSLVNGLADKGYNINQGVILLDNDLVYVGADALVHIDRLITPSTWGDSFVLSICKNRLIIVRLYPIMKMLRVIIFVLQGKRGKRKI